jgi:hypothetical protein
MLLATIGGLIITPYLYYLVASLSEKLGGKKTPTGPPPKPESPPDEPEPALAGEEVTS